MKCKYCHGTGKIDGSVYPCDKCNGTGRYEPFDVDVELDKLYPTEQTNEEWRKTCSTDEFAEFLSDVVFNAIVDYRIDKDNCEKEDGNYWLKWLKQPHKGD